MTVVAHLESYLYTLHTGAYAIIWACALGESLPVLGFIIPGQALVIGGGFVARIGHLDLGDVIILATLGTAIGDELAYYAGEKHLDALVARFGKKIFFKAEYLEKTKVLVREHPKLTILFGRFNAITRAFAPFVAGAARMPKHIFFVYNVVGGFLWASAYVVVGYIFGTGYAILGPHIRNFLFIFSAVIVPAISLYRFTRKKPSEPSVDGPDQRATLK